MSASRAVMSRRDGSVNVRTAPNGVHLSKKLQDL